MKSFFLMFLFCLALVGCSPKPSKPATISTQNSEISPSNLNPGVLKEKSLSTTPKPLALKPTTPKPTKLPPWNGKLVVLDPGHGGWDSGCYFDDGSGVLITEDEHVYDVCCRAKRLLEESGYKVVFTIEDKATHYTIRNIPKIPKDDKEVLISNPKLTLKLNCDCMDARIKLASKAEGLFKPKHIFWVSVHFDSQGNDKLQGAHIVTSYNGEFTNALLTQLRSNDLVRKLDGIEYHPVGMNGDPRKLYILREDKNPFSRCLLLELGNIQNPIDRSRLVNPVWRQKWASVICDSIKNTPMPEVTTTSL